MGSTELNDRLIEAAWANDVKAARELIEQGADVNAQDDTRQSAYLIATSEGHVELLDLTFDNGLIGTVYHAESTFADPIHQTITL